MTTDLDCIHHMSSS